MAVVVVGLNHTTAPVAVRERLAFSDATLAKALAHFRPPEVQELVVLSTCNRVEMYMQTNDVDASVASAVACVAACHAVPPTQFTPYLYQWSELEAVRHLFRVAASLDSLVLGEPQILGQVKAAYLAAQAAGRTGMIFSQLFERALRVAKTIRTETGISDHAVSVSYAAVELAKKIFESLQQRTVMVLGAGDTAELAARHLVSQGVTRVFIANRTSERAVLLAQALQAKAIPWEMFPEHLAYTDIVISSTSAPHPIIEPAMVREALRARRGRPMFFIDIAVPRDIDPSVNEIDNVFLYDIDDLQQVIDENLKERLKEASRAEEIIASEVEAFCLKMKGREVVPTIVQLRETLEKLRRDEIERNRRHLKDLSPEQQEALDQITKSLVNKILHTPIEQLKQLAHDPQGPDIADLIRKIFNVRLQ